MHRATNPAFNQPPDPKTPDLLEMVFATCRAHPLEPAIQNSGGTVTYDALQQAALALSNSLGDHLGRGQIAAICTDDTRLLVLGIMAVLHRGGCFVLLDPALPAARQKAELDLAAPTVVLVPPESPQAETLFDSLPKIPLSYDLTRHALAPIPPEAAHPEDPCSLFFTSGSSGRPKAIWGRLGALGSYIQFHQEQIQIQPGDRVAQLARPSFDSILRETFLALCSGATLVQPSQSEGQAGPDLARWLSEQQIQILCLVPSVFRLLIPHQMPHPPRAVLLAGERVEPADVLSWRAQHGQETKLYNLYGPTETALTSMLHPIRDEDAATGLIPIGKPIRRRHIWIGDPWGTPLPTGTVGEIMIQAPYAALGYLRQPALTADRFIPSVMGPSGARVFRTGDLGRCREDGVFEILGRTDRQMKIRGVRIQPEELEAALLTAPGVKQAAVVGRAQGQEMILHGFVSGDGVPDVATLREQLAQRFPPWMLPSALTLLPELPLLANGKLDRKRLETWTDDGRLRSEAAQTPEEAQICAFFAQVLELEAVGRDENFFTIGGHSLSAARVLARINDAFRVRYPMEAFFQEATPAATAARLHQLPTHQPRVTHTLAGQRLPLTPTQKRLWFLHYQDPEDTAYIMRKIWRIAGPLDQDHLKAALAALFQRHGALCARFPTLDGEQVQQAVRPDVLPLTFIDGLSWPDDRLKQESEAQLNQFYKRTFRLDGEPLARFLLIRERPNRHVLALSLHHLIGDAWSMDVISDDLWQLVAHQADPSQPEPLAPADYWSHPRFGQALDGVEMKTLLRDRARELTGVPTTSPIQADFAPKAGTRAAGVSMPLQLGAAQAQSVHDLARTHGTTPFNVCLTLFAGMLMRHAEVDELLIGVPLANRETEDERRMVGLFLETLVVHLKFDGNPSFEHALTRTRQAVGRAFACKDVPFQDLVAVLNPPRVPGRNPLFQVMFNFINVGDGIEAPQAVGALQIDREEWDLETTAKFDLTFYLRPFQEGYRGEFRFAGGRFSAATMQKLTRRFNQILTGWCAHPGLSLNDLLFERRTQDWPVATPEMAARPVPVHLRVLDQARQRPAAPALRQGTATVSYGQLAKDIETLAARLHGAGVGKGQVVAAYSDDRHRLITAMNAVLHRGGVFLLLTPDLPQERLNLMLRTAQVQWVLVDRALASTLEMDDAHLLCFEDQEREALQALPEPIAINPLDPAYIYFTSGSTGVPKAVLGQAGGLAHFIAWEAEALEASVGDCYGQLTRPTFDVFLRDIFLPLCSGGVLVLPEVDEPLVGQALADWLNSHRIEALHMVPTLFRTLLDAQITAADFPALKTIALAGEPIKPHDLTRWTALFGERIALFNLYGPTETTLAKFCHRIQAEDAAGNSVPVGLPLPGTAFYLRNAKDRPCAEGEVGEVVIQTPHRSHGYLNQPAMTAERFRPSPFGDGQTGYRTGDLGRLGADGRLYLLGRVDRQVKIRGVRLEIGEIENTLLRHPHIRNAAVLAVPDDSGVPSLRAYLEVDAHQPPNVWRAFLAQSLVENAVPTVWFQLTSLPRLHNGKIDYRRLAAMEPEPVEKEADGPYRDELEASLAAVWAGIFKQSRVDRRQNFFDAGGHSLLAMQLIARVNHVLGINLSIRDIFDAPRLDHLAQRIAAHRRGEGQEQTHGPSKRLDAHAPLSHEQRRLWAMYRILGPNPAYNNWVSWRLPEGADQDAAAGATRDLLLRHNELCAWFPEQDGEPTRVYADPKDLPLTVVDLTATNTSLTDFLAQQTRRSFHPDQGPLFKAFLLWEGPGRAVFLAVLHHLVSDEESLHIIRAEWPANYARRLAGDSADAQPTPLSYGDFAAWQHERAEGRSGALAWWRAQLEGASGHLELPADRPQPRKPTFAGGQYSFDLDADDVTRLEALGARTSATSFMLLLTVFAVLLRRYSNQDDLIVGTPYSNRGRPELQGLVGFFVNTLALRLDLSGNPNFEILLERVRTTALDAFAHADLSFDHLIKELDLDRDLGIQPLVQVLFAFRDNRGRAKAKGFKRLAVGRRFAKFDLHLTIAAGDKSWTAQLLYSSERFNETTIVHMAEAFKRLLHTMVHTPQTPVGQAPMLSPTWEMRLQQINATQKQYHQSPLLHGAFETWAKRTPHAVAIIGAQDTTYAQLNQQADQLAQALAARGVGLESIVGIFMERSLERIVAQLAVLKAGAAWCPLEPSLPADRLRFMIADGGIQTILVHEATQASVSDWPDALLSLPLDPDLPRAAVRAQAYADSAAYLIYTSGSTGRPKGVINHHQPVVNRLAWGQETFAITPSDKVLQKTPYAFDVSVWELFWPLSNGATLVLTKPDGHRDPDHLVDCIQRHKITMIHFVPSMLAAFLEAVDLARCSTLKHVFCSGEALKADPARRLLAQLPVKLHNLYGPTEAAIEVTHSMMTDHVPDSGAPMGRPIANTRVFVVDDQMQPLPPGVPGNFYIGGMPPARGYLGRPGLTAERFIPDPFPGAAPGARLYKTGDRAMFLEDGSLRFLGRLDGQIKLRGLRIELGEVEARLVQHPQVTGAAVTVHGNQLTAYVTGETLETTVLKQHLLRFLPSYMVPTLWTFLDRMPRLPSGKINRKALKPATTTETRAEPAEASPTQAVLLSLWQDVLKREDIGLEDNFFQLGGDSISAIQVAARAAQHGLDLKPWQVMQHQTIVEMADILATAPTKPLVKSPAKDLAAPSLSPIQQWFFANYDAHPHHFNQTIVLETPPDLPTDVLDRALLVLFQRHPMLHTRFLKREGIWTQERAPLPHTVLEDTHDLSKLSPEEAEAAFRDSAAQLQASLDLSGGRPFRARWYPMADKGLLLLTAHHLVVDAVSWLILTDELTTCFTKGKDALPPPPQTSYDQWAATLLAQSNAPWCRWEAGYWRSLYECDPALLPFPKQTDRPYATGDLSLTEQNLDHLDPIAKLQSQPDAEPPLALVLSALALSLKELSPHEHLCIALEGHGRGFLFEDQDPSRTVGWFTALYPFVLPLRGTAAAIRARVADRLDAVPNGGLGFGMLRHLTRNAGVVNLPMPQIVVNYMGRRGLSSKQALFQRRRLDVGPRRDPHAPTPFALEITVNAAPQRCRVSWRFRSDWLPTEAMTRWQDAFAKALDLLCQTPRSKTITSPKEVTYPLSPVQEGMLFHTLMAPESGFYLEQRVFTLNASVDAALYRKAWTHIIQRHDALRTVFAWEGLARPSQTVRPKATPEWTTHDWSGLSEEEAHAKLDDWLSADRKRGFDLQAHPPLRFATAHLPSGTRLLWSFHHLLFDGWSLALLRREAEDCYDALAAGYRGSFAEGPAYQRFIQWHEARDPSRDQVYWQRRLAGFDGPTPLPLERRRPTTQAADANHLLGVSLDAAQSQRLKDFARARGYTEGVVIMAAWAVLLSRFSGRRDVVFGQVVSGRPAELTDVETTVGLFINTVPVRVHVGNGPLQDWLREVAAAHHQRAEHVHQSLVDIARWGGFKQVDELFRCLLIIENYPATKKSSGARTNSAFLTKPHYPLSAAAVPGRQLKLKLGFQPEHFAPQDIKRILEVWRNLIVTMIRDDARFDQLQLLQPQQQKKILRDWAVNTHVCPSKQPFPAIFERWAEARPDAAAVMTETRDWTYAQLNGWANAVAKHLKIEGVMPEDRIGVALPAGAARLAALLGILKVGGVYLPLDLDLPEARLNYILEKAKPRYMVASKSKSLPALEADTMHTLHLDDLEDAPDPGNPKRTIDPYTLAYIVFTSGSTGQPKGVMIDHDSMTHMGHAMALVFGLKSDSRYLQVFPHFFDAGMAEVSMTWAAGGALCLPPNHGPLVGDVLINALKRFSVTDVILLPSVLALLPKVPLPHLRNLFAAAEKLPQTTADDWSPGRRFLNAYGPSETTVCATTAVYDEWVGVHPEPPIGKPIPGKRVYILDPNLSLLPEGVNGEIYIGGEAVARGYCDNPALTADRFLPDPYAEEPGARMYRTGDVGHYLPDGQIAFGGRVDNQVKVSGHRIELEEIEVHLMDHPQIDGAAAALGTTGGTPRIVAYIQTNEGEKGQETLDAALIQACRAFLRNRVPSYMMPHIWVEMLDLPRLPNGKINRALLPSPETAGINPIAQPPQTDREKELAKVFGQVLGLADMCILTPFRELGADSLQLLRVYAQLQPQYGEILSLRRLFTHATLQQLAAFLDDSLSDTATSEPTPETPAKPESRADKRLAFRARAQRRRPRKKPGDKDTS